MIDKLQCAGGENQGNTKVGGVKTDWKNGTSPLRFIHISSLETASHSLRCTKKASLNMVNSFMEMDASCATLRSKPSRRSSVMESTRLAITICEQRQDKRKPGMNVGVPSTGKRSTTDLVFATAIECQVEESEDQVEPLLVQVRTFAHHTHTICHSPLGCQVGGYLHTTKRPQSARERQGIDKPPFSENPKRAGLEEHAVVTRVQDSKGQQRIRQHRQGHPTSSHPPRCATMDLRARIPIILYFGMG